MGSQVGGSRGSYLWSGMAVGRRFNITPWWTNNIFWDMIYVRTLHIDMFDIFSCIYIYISHIQCYDFPCVAANVSISRKWKKWIHNFENLLLPNVWTESSPGTVDPINMWRCHAVFRLQHSLLEHRHGMSIFQMKYESLITCYIQPATVMPEPYSGQHQGVTWSSVKVNGLSQTHSCPYFPHWDLMVKDVKDRGLDERVPTRSM